MHHDLDIHSVPKQPFFINEPELIDPSLGYYDPERKIPADEMKDYKKAKKYEDVRRFHKYPEASDDNIRVYIPMDLNAEAILRRLGEIIGRYGAASEYNESNYSSEVGKIITQLEIYDQVWFVREMREAAERERAKGKSFALLRNRSSDDVDGNDDAGIEIGLKDGTAHFVGLNTEHDKTEEHIGHGNDHSQHGLELVKKIIKRLENIPDACAEMFPFETIDELNMEWFGIKTHTESK